MNSIELFRKSEAFTEITAFLQHVNSTVFNVCNTQELHESENVNKIIEMIKQIAEWIQEFPPTKTVRFGNISFRDWISRVESISTKIHFDLLPTELHQHVEDLQQYFVGSFGNEQRIDYGSGHELSFVAWILCLTKIGFLVETDLVLIPTRIMVHYLSLVRKLQTVYTLEPAGSHGVWGLDDFQFIPYYWGAAQLIGELFVSNFNQQQDHPHIKPKSIMQMDIVDNFANDYLYLGCIKYIHQVKKGVFAEHSPLLHDISGVPSWTKVNQGLFKMFIDHVLMKFPVMQHFAFTKLLALDELKS